MGHTLDDGWGLAGQVGGAGGGTDVVVDICWLGVCCGLDLGK